MTSHLTDGAAGPPRPAVQPSECPPGLSGGNPASLQLHDQPPCGGAGTKTPRTFTLEIPPGTVLRTSNDRLHRMEEHKRNKVLRELGQQLAREQRIPRLERADVLTTYIPPPRAKKDRHPLASARVEDAGSLYPTSKALIDGCRDAGVWADDNFRHVRREIYQLLDGTCPRGRLKLHIIEVPS